MHVVQSRGFRKVGLYENRNIFEPSITKGEPAVGLNTVEVGFLCKPRGVERRVTSKQCTGKQRIAKKGRF